MVEEILPPVGRAVFENQAVAGAVGGGERRRRLEEGREVVALVAGHDRERGGERVVVVLDAGPAEEVGLAVRRGEAVPAVHEATVKLDVVRRVPVDEPTPVGEGAGELIAVGLLIEEVADGGHAFVADDRVKVAELEREIPAADLGVELGDREAVILATVPIRRAGIRFPAQRHREWKILAIQHVGTGPDAGGSVGGKRPFADDVNLIHHRFVGAIDGVVGAVELAWRHAKVAHEAAVEPARDAATVSLAKQEPVLAGGNHACHDVVGEHRIERLERAGLTRSAHERLLLADREERPQQAQRNRRAAGCRVLNQPHESHLQFVACLRGTHGRTRPSATGSSRPSNRRGCHRRNRRHNRRTRQERRKGRMSPRRITRPPRLG